MLVPLDFEAQGTPLLLLGAKLVSPFSLFSGSVVHGQQDPMIPSSLSKTRVELRSFHAAIR
jgi:hypothetical protein